MAWYDKVADAASIVMPLAAPAIQGGKALGNWAGGKDAKLFGADTTYTPPPAPKQVRKVTKVDAGAFDPYANQQAQQGADPFNNQQFAGVYGDAGDLARASTMGRNNAEGNLSQGFAAPGYSNIRPGTVTANTAGVGAGIDRAAGQLAQSNQSRVAQEGILGTALDWSRGNMPSVGRDIANEAGVVANDQFLRAGSESNQQYGLASQAAQLGFSNAAAEQAEQTRRAGITAGQQTRDAATDAVLRNSALVAGARGGNMGLALRNAQQGAAFQGASANRDASRQVASANDAAAYAAAAAQRQAAAQQASVGIVTQGTQERSGFAAAAAEQAARLRGAQIGSQEQQNALALAGQTASGIRGDDLSSIGAATGIANVGLGMDSLVTGTNAGNADRSFAADQFNQQLNAQNQLATNTLNANVWSGQAGRMQGDQQFGIGTQAGLAQQATQQDYQMAMAAIQGNQQLAALYAQMDESAKQRMLDEYAIQQGQATERRGQNTGIFGAGLSGVGAMGAAGIMMSDKRAKRHIKPAKTPDFRKATHATYEYTPAHRDKPASGRGKFAGPMAQQLPKEVLRTDRDGMLNVDIGRLALHLTSAVGELQRKTDGA